MQISNFMGVTDLNGQLNPCILPLRTPEEEKNVYRHTTRIFAGHGLPATPYLPKVCGINRNFGGVGVDGSWTDGSCKWWAIWHFGSMGTNRLMPRRFVKWEREMTEKYCASLAIEDNLWPGFAALYWLYRVSQAVLSFDETWVKRNVIKPLPRILKAVSMT